MTDGMIVLDSQERIVDVNPPAQEIMGRTAAEVIGRPAVQAIRVLAQQPELIERYRKSGLLQTEILVATTEPPRYLDVRVSPLRDQQARSTGHLIVFRDITERKQAEEQIRAQNEILVKTNQELALARKQAELAAELKNQFLANVSHELRTPLSAIIGYTEIQMAGMVGELTPELLRYQQRVLSNAEQLLGLINSILDLSKIEAGYMELSPKPFKLRAWLNEIETQNRILAEKKGLRFEVELDEQLPELLVADAARLKQILTNLLSNAIKFTDDGFVRVSLNRHTADTWKMMVCDSGIGIPAADQAAVFEEFRQLDGSFSRQYGGTGLGLAIVSKLVRLMKGAIQLQSEVGQGSTFIVILPYAQAQAMPATD
jgi:PAS domain S-box-containing protein